ncbi:MAG: prolipoprotein diacylglyceryl transferase [Syntrophales bacterium]|nr:prolipoprotein diacylglyceryl transferase [Syntrophales bacterium]
MGNWLYLWQHLPWHINPNIFKIGSFQIRYYSMMYFVAFLMTYLLISYRIKHEDYDYTTETIQDYLLWAITGLIIGARLGYVLFYNLAYYLRHPLEIILPFDFTGGFRFVGLAGMSYHGGAIGVLVVTIIFCRRRRINIWHFTDLLCSAVPLGYTFGRIGNFINGELFGRATDVPWGMYFPLDEMHRLRHPSQLYEALFEGIVLFIFLWSIRKKKPFDGFMTALYIIGYGSARFFVEFFREPDVQLGLLWGGMSMGQNLCIIMILTGVGILFYRRKRR